MSLPSGAWTTDLAPSNTFVMDDVTQLGLETYKPYIRLAWGHKLKASYDYIYAKSEHFADQCDLLNQCSISDSDSDTQAKPEP